jgi:hypothetical protein
MQTSDVTPWLEDSRNGGYPWPPTKPDDIEMHTDHYNEGLTYH